MPAFCKLADPASYRPCDWDLGADAALRTFWLDHFTAQIESTLSHARRQYAALPDLDDRIAAVRREFLAGIEARRARPGDFSPLDVINLDHLRQDLLNRHGLSDPYRDVRRQENEAMLPLYPRLIAELDATGPARRLLELASGLFAGNIFDLGSMEFLERYSGRRPDFFEIRRQVGRRPWLVDHYDALAERLAGPSPAYHKAMVFVDNAGSDIVLGVMPLVRELAGRGVEVVISANAAPALNDVSAEEADWLCEEIARHDPVFGRLRFDGRISVVDDGNTIPLLDLRQVSESCDRAARDCDLVVLEGMGRAIESNWNARFSCDCLKVALIKNPSVAERLGGRNYDAVCRLDRAGPDHLAGAILMTASGGRGVGGDLLAQDAVNEAPEFLAVNRGGQGT